MTTSPLADDFIPANAKHQEGANGRVSRIVIHATVSPCVKGGARNVARYFQSTAAGGAAHYVVDPEEIIGCVDEDRIAHHAPPNTGSIGVELCDPMPRNPDGSPADPERWNDQPHTLMLARAAALVADICARRGIPVQWLTPTQLLAGDAGETSHRNVALAWRRTNHTDPGPAFPIDLFIAAVARHANPTPPEEDDMPPAPATVELPDGNVVTVMRGADHATYFYCPAPGSFSPLPGSWASGPSVTATAKQLIVRGVGTDGALYETRLALDGTTPAWSTPQPLGGKAG